MDQKSDKLTIANILSVGVVVLIITVACLIGVLQEQAMRVDALQSYIDDIRGPEEERTVRYCMDENNQMVIDK